MHQVGPVLGDLALQFGDRAGDLGALFLERKDGDRVALGFCGSLCHV
ncbi:MAG TPA: hypothetical protein VK657_08865 [Terriglobales bacterium]|nr:hypothetical protein [Terriglobales bacterium]